MIKQEYIKKQPERQCIACREKSSKKDFIRIVKSPGNEISLDEKGKKPGRGAYLCLNEECLNRIIKTRALSRAFKMQIPETVYEEITNICKNP